MSLWAVWTPLLRRSPLGCAKHFGNSTKRVLVTHDLAEAAFFADDVVLLNGGRIAQQQPPRSGQQPASPFVKELVESAAQPWEALREAIARRYFGLPLLQLFSFRHKWALTRARSGCVESGH